ncbi:MAG: sulfate ABC transporter ATP-binding protein, partial [Cyanobacteriota bacterium]|nr:sulfate ABC transporter ATP-binding protein [Cyanobacteriota bacterium]
RLKRIIHSGRDVQMEVLLDDGEIVVAQVARDSIDYKILKPGDELHINLRQSRSFVPDYSI